MGVWIDGETFYQRPVECALNEVDNQGVCELLSGSLASGIDERENNEYSKDSTAEGWDYLDGMMNGSRTINAHI